MSTNTQYHTMDLNQDPPDPERLAEMTVELQKLTKDVGKKVKTLSCLASIFAISTGIFLFLSLYLGWLLTATIRIPPKSIIIPTIDMAINHEISDDSAAAYERSGDVKRSPYYTFNNYYDGKITDSLKILPKFQTYQQTSSYSCGPASAFMAFRYFNITEFTENDIALVSGTQPHIGTDTLGLAHGIEELVGDLVKIEIPEKDLKLSWEEYFKMIKENLKNNKVMIVCSIEWGGHWLVLIGYDNMGTEGTGDDVIILADPFDTTDHNQDGYLVLSAERFYSTWVIYGSFPEGYNKYQYVTLSKK